MIAPARIQYRDRLAEFADDSMFAEVLEPFGSGPWRRTYGRFEPDRSPWATLVHQSQGPDGSLVTVELYDPVRAPKGSAATRVGPARVQSYADDERLAGLGPVLASVITHEVVRYRPRKRCTLRVGTIDGARFVKVLASGHENVGVRIISEARQLWHAVQAGDLGFTVAEPDHFDWATASVWHHAVAGDPITPVLAGPDAAAMGARIGTALGELASAPLRAGTTTRRSDQVARTARAVARASSAVPELASGLGQRLDCLAAAASRLGPERSFPIHGAPHADQWLQPDPAGDGRLSLVDFDRFAMGEPELDVATFLSELEDESDLAVDRADIASALVTGYQRAGPDLDPSLIGWYRAHKRIAKVARTATSLRPDGARRAARHLANID